MKKHAGAAMKTIALGAGILAAILIILMLGLAFIPISGIPSGGKIYKVEKGEGAAILARGLESEGLIRSAVVFMIAARLGGASSSLKAGTYKLEPGMNLVAVLSAIANGRQYTVRITIPEGYTARMIAGMLAEAGIVRKDEFLSAVTDRKLCTSLGVPASSLEGYLFPDTYFFPPEADAREVAGRMVGAFRERLSEFPEASSMDPVKLHETVILASIIEREYRIPSDAPLMASVFLNRLAIGMRLQSCATVVYVITEKEGKPHPEIVTRKDLTIPDAYNTYLHKGLPPGPISNPGMTSFRAVFFPAKTPYFYFRLTDPATGSHRFSRTLDEHVDTGSYIVKKPGK